MSSVAIHITTLVENSPGEHKALLSEHGLSFHIEKDGHTLLFDTGQSDAFLHNCSQLALDPLKIEYVILSHGHYDHSGGIRHLAEKTTDFKLITGQGFFEKKYGDNEGSKEFLGNNFDQQFLQDNKISSTCAETDITEIIPAVYVITNFPRIHPDEVINPRFTLLKEGLFEPDVFQDEVLLAIDSPHGLIILLGCSHPGIKNMIAHAVTLLQRPVYGVMGGTHLVEANEQSMELSLDYLKKHNPEIIGFSHCTGKQAMGRLAKTNSHYYHNRTGSSVFIA